MRNRKMWWKWARKSIREGSKTYIQFLQKIPFCRLIPTFFVHLERIAPWSPCLSDFKHLSSVFCLLCCTEVANDLLNTKFNSLACLPPTEPPCCIWLGWFYPSSNSLFLILHWIYHPHGSLCLWLLLSILQFIFLFLSEEIYPQSHYILLFAHSTDSFPSQRLSSPYCYLNLNYFSLNLHCFLTISWLMVEFVSYLYMSFFLLLLLTIY